VKNAGGQIQTTYQFSMEHLFFKKIREKSPLDGGPGSGFKLLLHHRHPLSGVGSCNIMHSAAADDGGSGDDIWL
jgi:hypothetical protein